MICSEIGTKVKKTKRKEQKLVETVIGVISGDRRVNRRYAAELPLSYSVIRNGHVISSGYGQTIDLSSTGTALMTGDALEPGAWIEMAIEWPAGEGVSPLQLLVAGRVVRSDRFSAAIRNELREFRAEREPLAMAAG